MNSDNIGIIGGGNMGMALTEGLLRSGKFEASRIIIKGIITAGEKADNMYSGD